MNPADIVAEGKAGTGAAWIPHTGTHMLPKTGSDSGKKKSDSSGDVKDLAKIGEDAWWRHNKYFEGKRDEMLQMYVDIANDKNNPFHDNPMADPKLQDLRYQTDKESKFSKQMMKDWTQQAEFITRTGRDQFTDESLEAFFSFPDRYEEILKNREAMPYPIRKPETTEWYDEVMGMAMPPEQVRKYPLDSGETKETKKGLKSSLRTQAEGWLDWSSKGKSAFAQFAEESGEYDPDGNLTNYQTVREKALDFIVDQRMTLFEDEEKLTESKKGGFTMNFGGGSGSIDNGKFKAIYTQEPKIVGTGGSWTGKFKDAMNSILGKTTKTDAIAFVNDVPQRQLVITKEDVDSNFTDKDVYENLGEREGRQPARITPAMVYEENGRYYVIGEYVYKNVEGTQKRGNIKFELKEKSTKDAFESNYLDGMSVEEFIRRSKEKPEDEAEEEKIDIEGF